MRYFLMVRTLLLGCCLVYCSLFLHAISHLWKTSGDGGVISNFIWSTEDTHVTTNTSEVSSKHAFSKLFEASSSSGTIKAIPKISNLSQNIPENSFIHPCVYDSQLLLNMTSPERQQVKFNCNVTGIFLHTEEIPSSQGVLTIENENRKCLRTFVKRFCYESSDLTIPNVAHYVWFGSQDFRAHHLVSVLSVLRFQKPCVVLFHGDSPPQGRLWTLLLHLSPRVFHVRQDAPEMIFGKKLGYVQHKSDIVRIQVLRDLGGMYLDTDQLLLRDVTSQRTEQVVMSHENKNNLANSLILSRPGAKFLEVWYNHYRYYNSRQWGYHSTFVPWIIAQRYPSLIKVVDYKFVYPDFPDIRKVYLDHIDVSSNLGLHLYTRLVDVPLELDNMARANSTLGEVWRKILYGSEKIPQCS